MGWDDMNWIDLAQNRDQWRTLVYGNESSGAIECFGYSGREEHFEDSQGGISLVELLRNIFYHDKCKP
jgi:hypothetical protein